MAPRGRFHHEGARLPRTRPEGVGGRTGPRRSSAPDRRDRRRSTPPRSAAPTCTSSRATSRRSPTGGSSATRASGRSPRSAQAVAHARRRRPGDHLLHQLVRLVLLLPPGPATRTAWPTRAPPASAGSSATSSTAPRPSSCGCPFADNSLYKLPEGVSDEAAVMLSDILPTGFEIGVRYGRVKPGDVVAVVGAGPVGLAAMMTAGLYGASRVIAARPRRQPARAGQGLRCHRRASTAATRTGRTQVMAMTDGFGVDVAIEAVGHPGDLRWLHRRSSAPAGRWRTSVCTASPVELALQDLWIKDIAITMGLVSTHDDADAAQAGRPGQARRRRSSPPTASRSTRSSRPTTPSAAPPRPRRSRSSSGADRTSRSTGRRTISRPVD